MSDQNYPAELGRAFKPGTDDALKLLCKDSKIIEALSKHYTDLFIYQARQRLDSIRYFFVGYAVFATAVTALATAGNVAAAMILSLLGGVISLVFLRLDYRNAQIVEIDEKPLKGLQSFFSNISGGGDSWETFERCDKTRRRLTTYGDLIRLLYLFFWASSFVAAIALANALLVNSRYATCADLLTGGFGLVLLIVGVLAMLWRPKVSDEYRHP